MIKGKGYITGYDMHYEKDDVTITYTVNVKTNLKKGLAIIEHLKDMIMTLSPISYILTVRDDGIEVIIDD